MSEQESVRTQFMRWWNASGYRAEDACGAAWLAWLERVRIESETPRPEDVHTDAERYRFLRDGMHEDINVCDWSHVQWPSEQPYAVRGAAVDALVDKARSTPQKDEG